MSDQCFFCKRQMPADMDQVIDEGWYHTVGPVCSICLSKYCEMQEDEEVVRFVKDNPSNPRTKHGSRTEHILDTVAGALRASSVKFIQAYERGERPYSIDIWDIHEMLTGIAEELDSVG